MKIPNCDIGLIGGSSTLSAEIPEDLGLDYVEVKEKSLVFPTPYGPSPEFKLLILHNFNELKPVLCCRMHGWRSGVSRADASRQVFWVFKQAGVKRVLAEGGVGAINHLLKPRDIVIPHDYMDFSLRKDVCLEDRYLLMMRDALCAGMIKELNELVTRQWKKGRVFDRGVYVNTDGRHFESPSEVAMFKMTGGDVVGQSICPEVYLAREIGACYAGVYMVVNYAEGIVSPWQHEELEEIFNSESLALGRCIFEFLRGLEVDRTCECTELRKDTLLKKVYK
ncbi:MAG: MTAP family purine nucleoside phosphorylase [Syntrophomonadaceae bacterium]|nr:MTAP family purine nucleoside phosphorylase [Syntrophomonadaceae bacterium]